MGKYDDISDQLAQYVSRSTLEATVDGTENDSVPDDSPSVTDDEGAEEKGLLSDMKTSTEPKVGPKVYKSVYIASLFTPIEPIQ